MKSLGLALGSGGVKGLAHIGVIKALVENNIKISAIAGSSAGALIGAYYALTKRIDYLEQKAYNFLEENPFKLFDYTNFTSREKKLTTIKLFLEELYKDKRFKDLKIPFAAVATDLETGNEVIINQGRIIDAVAASIAIPGVFDPVFFWGKWLVDGGVVNPTPLAVTKDLGVDFVLGIDLTQTKEISINKKPKPLFVLSRALGIMISDIARYRFSDIKEKMLLYFRLGDENHFNVKTAEKLINFGYEQMINKVDELKDYLKER